jgi:hypothetical protein
MSISDLDRKITYSRKDDFDKLQSISLYAHDESESSSQNLKALKVTSTGDLKVDISSGSGSHGLATEAKQDDQITKLTSIDDKIVKSANQTPASGTAIEMLMYGRDFTYGNLEALRTNSSGHVFVDTSLMAQTNSKLDTLNSNISSGNDDSISGNLQQNLVYGRYDFNGNLNAMKVSSDGSVITSPAGGTIVTSDGTTSEQRVMVLGNHNGNLRTLKCGNGGALATELDHSWDNTNTLINIVTTPAGATITSNTFDLGQGVSHELGAVEFFLTNSASLDVEVTPEVSVNGTVWYSMANPMPVITTKQYVSFGQEEIGISVGNRYMRFQVTNNDSLASTDITLIVGYYK